MTALSRRRFLQVTGLAALASSVRRPALAHAATTPMFDRMSPAETGITWRHVNARSPEYYLPETTGAGCGFIDYDNDGWMHLYLINRGKFDFYNPEPPLRNA